MAQMSVWRSIESNPAALVAFIAALVTLISFLFNYRATLRNQRDQQFYEALKRFGDGASPALRSSASGLLAQMAKLTNWFRRPYFTTALDQLMMGIFLETNPLALRAIGKAIGEIARTLPRAAIPALHEANLRLQEDVAAILAQLSALEAPPSEEQSAVLARRIGRYIPTLISTLLDAHAERVAEAQRAMTQQCAGLSVDAKRERHEALEGSRQLAGARLEQNCDFLATALDRVLSDVISVEISGTPERRRSKVKASPMWRQRARAISLRGVFLPGLEVPMRAIAKVDFDGAILTGADFGTCLIQDCSFNTACLEGASFAGSVLKSRIRVTKTGWSLRGSVELSAARLDHADLSDAVLVNVRVRDADVTGARMVNTQVTETWRGSWKGTNWWRAQHLPRPTSTDDASRPHVPPSAFATLYALYGADIPPDRNEMDPSVAELIATR